MARAIEYDNLGNSYETDYEFKVLEASDIHEFERTFIRHKQEGWRPIGSMSISCVLPNWEGVKTRYAIALEKGHLT